MSRYLIVGGAGYIGSHVVRALVERGDTVVVLDNLSTGHLEAIATSGARFIPGDVCEGNGLDRLFRCQEFDCVMHFAASSLVGESVTKPLDYYANNAGGAIRLLEAMQRNGVDNFVFSSTAAVYGEPSRVPIEESCTPQPTNPYGRSKRFIEQLLGDCAKAYGLRYAALRYFNAGGACPSGEIGEDHSPETHLIPLVLQVALGQRERIDIYGTDWPTPDGTCVRDYVHVCDLADAHLLAADRLAAGGESVVFNLGNERGLSVREVVDLARRVTGREIPVRDAPRRSGDPARLVASSSRIRSALGWSPRFEDPGELIETAWRWHREHPHGY
ncbi:MAG: UDP-glucose 4-epimerase GalE [Acidobacteriota bacterium]|nr:UDP-glucose 4-epimerase GalE [Acidobacteriota bacterium]